MLVVSWPVVISVLVLCGLGHAATPPEVGQINVSTESDPLKCTERFDGRDLAGNEVLTSRVISAARDLDDANAYKKEAQQRLNELSAQRAPLRQLSDEATKLLSGSIGEPFASDQDSGQAALERARELYKRAEAKTSQAEGDIARVVAAVRQLLIGGARVSESAKGTLKLAQNLQDQMSRQQDGLRHCLHTAKTALATDQAQLRKKLSDAKAERKRLEEEHGAAMTAAKENAKRAAEATRVAQLLTQQAKAEMNHTRKIREQVDEDRKELEARREALQLKELQVQRSQNESKALQKQAKQSMADSKVLESNLTRREVELAKKKAQLRAKSKSAEEMMETAKTEQVKAESQIENATALHQRAGDAYERAKSMIRKANATKQRGLIALQEAQARFHKAAAKEELADQEMQDALNVLKGLDPQGQRALQQAFQRLSDAKNEMRQAHVQMQEVKEMGHDGRLHASSQHVGNGSDMQVGWAWLLNLLLFSVILVILGFLLWRGRHGSSVADESLPGGEPLVSFKAGPLACFCLRQQLAAAAEAVSVASGGYRADGGTKSLRNPRSAGYRPVAQDDDGASAQSLAAGRSVPEELLARSSPAVAGVARGTRR